jgi:hypothetical protein
LTTALKGETEMTFIDSDLISFGRLADPLLDPLTLLRSSRP